MIFFEYTGVMRKISALITYAAALLLTPQFALAANVGACYNISDSDARSYCVAKARKDVSQCYNIQQPGLRSLCLSEVAR